MTQTPPEAESLPTETVLDWDDPSTLPVEEVKALFVVLGKALRSQQLYDENNPVYQRFVSQLGEALTGLWPEMERLPVHVDEDSLMWMGETVYESESRGDSLAFLLYKDGIREFTLHQGLEGKELPVFLQVLNQARDLRATKGDDLLTILWEKDLSYFTYSYVDVLAEGVDLDLPSAGSGFMGGFEKILEEEVGPEELEKASQELSATDEEEGESPAKSLVDDFNPTLYSLDPMELEKVQEEVRIEMTRDLRGDVLAALFDRIEEPKFPERQDEILGIFEVLLPNFLGRGALDSAGSVLEEMARLLASEEALNPDQRIRVEEVLDKVSGADTLRELIQALEDGAISPDPAELSALLRHLRADALGPLLRGAEEAEDKRIKGIIQEAATGIARKFSTALLRYLESDDPVVVAGAVSLAGKMGLSASAPLVARLLSHKTPEVRLAAIGAAADLRVPTVLNALREVLLDTDRDVRIAAAKAIGDLRFRPAAPHLREAIESKEIRQADISEQIAFFESYGLVQDPDAVRLLDGLLNRRSLLGRRESGEIRACAALGLGKIATPEAIAALEKAQAEQDPVVRSAVNRALRGEG